jgi:predicted transcriptional regulator
MTLAYLARHDDADTSHEAAEAMAEAGVVVRHERMIVTALSTGAASKCEIARRCGLTEQQVNRRLADLRRRGVIERTGRDGISDSGHREAEYRLHEASGDALAGDRQGIAEFAESLVAVWDRLERQR